MWYDPMSHMRKLAKKKEKEHERGSDMKTMPQVTVAGHICLDVIPSWPGTRMVRELGELLQPGKLVQVGPAVISAGGAVSNTGVALHRLGVPVRLMGKVGDDLIGRSILEVLGGQGRDLARGVMVIPGQASSYSIVINPPAVDRVFLHCPGANDTFVARDVPYDRLKGQRLFHFGYPPVMMRMCIDGGKELARMFKKVKWMGLATSLDMAHIDPAASAGKVDWPGLLRRTLPYVDLFLPSLEETLFMLDRRELGRRETGGQKSGADGALMHRLAEQLLEWGAAVVGFKLGDQGMYLRTSASAKRLARVGGGILADIEAWRGREMLAPCFAVKVAGTTGAGDCTIAGLLAALLKGMGPEEAMTTAVAVGACCVEKTDATSGVVTLAKVRARIKGGWERVGSRGARSESRGADGRGAGVGKSARRERRTVKITGDKP